MKTFGDQIRDATEKTFSDQIRDAIESSCVTRYVLAGQAGIAESALSRFMSGKQGMSLSTLDKIAKVLGLQVRVGVQELPKSRKPGRPKKEEPKMQQLKTLTSADWGRLAQNAAKDAYENHHPSRRGLYVVEGVGIVYYDNNPFKLPREKDRREDLISQFRDFLQRSKIKERACAYYPPAGESKDYTFAMVIEAEALMLKAIRICFLQIVDKFINGWHEGIDLGHPADGDTRRYTIPSSTLGGAETSEPSKTAQKGRGRPQLYDWDKWFARRRFTLRRGEDYRCSQSSMSQQVRNAAAARGLNVSLVEGEGQLTVLVHPAPYRPAEGQRGGESN
jgi:transcriptional regulator with XRE-family HTH domain